MSLESLLKTETWTSDEFDKYVKSCGGIYKLRKRNLDMLIKAHAWLIHDDSFMDIYRMVSDKESAVIMQIWTWVVGFASIISLIISILSYNKMK